MDIDAYDVNDVDAADMYDDTHDHSEYPMGDDDFENHIEARERRTEAVMNAVRNNKRSTTEVGADDDVDGYDEDPDKDVGDLQDGASAVSEDEEESLRALDGANAFDTGRLSKGGFQSEEEGANQL